MIRLVGLNLRRWRSHRARTALSLIGVAVGVALVVAVTAMYGSLSRSIERSTSDLAGRADLEVAGLTESGFDAHLLDQVAAVPGVRAAVPLIRSTVVIGHQQTLLFGFDQRASQIAPKLGAGSTDPRDPKVRVLVNALLNGQLVAGRGLVSRAHLRPGAGTTVASPAGAAPVTFGAVIDGGDANRLNQGVFAVAALPVAQHLAGKDGRLDSVLIVAAPGTDAGALQHRLEEVVAGRAAVASPKLRAEQVRASTKQIEQALLLGAAMALGVGGFLVFNTMNMAALERRRELATLRAVGGRRRTLLGAFLGEAAVLGLAGSAVGAAAGAVLGRRLVGLLPQIIVSTFGVRVGFSMPAAAIPLALAAGVATTVAASYLPARRALSVAPVEAMRPEGVLETAGEGDAVAWPAAVAGAAMLLGGLVGCVAGPSQAAMAALVLMLLGGPTLLYGVAGPFARSVGGLARRFGPAGHLAAESIERAPRRAWSTASAVMLAVGIVVAQNGLTRDAKASVQDNLAPIGRTDFYVSTGLNANFSTAMLFGHDVEDRIRHLPGVASTAGSQFSFATLGRARIMLQGVEDGVLDPSLTLVRRSARPALLAGHGVVVSTQFAGPRHLHRGSLIDLPTPTGVRRLPVLDVIESFKWDKGVIVMSLPALEQWFGRVGAGDLYVEAAPGADRAAVGRAIRAATADLPFDVAVDTGPQFMKAVAASADQVNATFVAMQWIIVGAALLAVLNALLIAVIERRRELGILRAIGTSRRMLRRMVEGEAGAVGLVAGALGLLVGVVSHYAALTSVGANTGYPMHYHFSFVPMIVAALSGAAVTVVGGALPARRAATVNIIEAIGYE